MHRRICRTTTIVARLVILIVADILVEDAAAIEAEEIIIHRTMNDIMTIHMIISADTGAGNFINDFSKSSFSYVCVFLDRIHAVEAEAAPIHHDREVDHGTDEVEEVS